MPKVLVTGGAGFIGSHVVDALIAKGFEAIVVDNLSSGKKENINPQADFQQIDICSPQMDKLFASENIDYVCHHAAQIDVRKSVDDPRFDAQVNISGLLNLLECCRRFEVKGVVFASSGGAIYGEQEVIPANEVAAKRPFSPYAVSKLASEYYLYYYRQVHGLPYLALRYSNVYGPRQDIHGEAGVIAIFSGKMLAAESAAIFGDGEQLRDYVYAGDVARANLLALKRLGDNPSTASIDGCAFNIGTSRATSVNELFARLQAITGFSGSASYQPERKGELRRSCLDAAKAEKDLGWRPEVGLTEGLKKTVEYWKSSLEQQE